MLIPAYLISRGGTLRDLLPIDSRHTPAEAKKIAEQLLVTHPCGFSAWFSCGKTSDFLFTVSLDEPGVCFASVWIDCVPCLLLMCFNGQEPEQEVRTLAATWQTLTEGLAGSGISVATAPPTLPPGVKAACVALPTLVGKEDVSGDAIVAFGAIALTWLQQSAPPRRN